MLMLELGSQPASEGVPSTEETSLRAIEAEL